MTGTERFGSTRCGPWHKKVALLPSALLLTALVACDRSDRDDHALAIRREAVAEAGRAVMPFDLDRTTHRFTPTAGGGVQSVTADSSEYAHEIELARAHLRKEAAAFAAGDYSDPIRIHGADMPGLADLRAGALAQRLEIEYADVPNGGQITYSTSDADLVAAVHAWFDAQVADHGRHAGRG